LNRKKIGSGIGIRVLVDFAVPEENVGMGED
jgi:hypothetical protein